MIEEVNIEVLREEGLSGFRKAIQDRVRSGNLPDAPFIAKSLLRAMTPILKAICGEDAKPEEHVVIHCKKWKTPQGQAEHHTQAEGLTQMGNLVIEIFMDNYAGPEA